MRIKVFRQTGAQKNPGVAGSSPAVPSSAGPNIAVRPRSTASYDGSLCCPTSITDVLLLIATCDCKELSSRSKHQAREPLQMHQESLGKIFTLTTPHLQPVADTRYPPPKLRPCGVRRRKKSVEKWEIKEGRGPCSGPFFAPKPRFFG